VELVAACRAAAGPGMTLMVDVAYCWSDWKEALRVLRRMEPYDIFFVETPLPSDDLKGYARLSDATQIRIAAGEWLQTRFEFLELMERGGVEVVQPDIGRVGGITEAVRVVQMALDHGKIVVRIAGRPESVWPRPPRWQPWRPIADSWKYSRRRWRIRVCAESWSRTNLKL
jgi:L-alanine-DL-glutamate epimerase-like enolase superfamily enzyme